MASSSEPLAATLTRAIDASLRGDKQAQTFLEGLATPDLSVRMYVHANADLDRSINPPINHTPRIVPTKCMQAGVDPLLSVWEAALQVLAASSPGHSQPHAYFAACLLRRCVRACVPFIEIMRPFVSPTPSSTLSTPQQRAPAMGPASRPNPRAARPGDLGGPDGIRTAQPRGGAGGRWGRPGGEPGACVWCSCD